jgi:hypothetical protein
VAVLVAALVVLSLGVATTDRSEDWYPLGIGIVGIPGILASLCLAGLAIFLSRQ